MEKPARYGSAARLRVGLLSGSLEVPFWMYTALQRLLETGCVDLVAVFLDKGEPYYRSGFDRLKKRWHKLIYFVLDRTDRWLFRQQPDAFELKDLTTLFPGFPIIGVVPIRSRISDRFAKETLEQITALEIDILIGLWPRILRGDILRAAKHGIWSYHHGDNRRYRGGPPGFWESMEACPETGSILQVLTEDLDGGKVLYKSWSLTYSLSPEKNRNSLYWTSASFLARQVSRLHRLGERAFYEDINHSRPKFDFFDRPLRRAPDNLEALGLALRYVRRILGRAVERIFYSDQWFLLFDLDGGSSTSLRRFKRILPSKDRFWADPHPIEVDGTFFIFIEEYIYRDRKARISVIEMDKDGKWQLPVPILEQENHLSYPFVFFWEGKFYMVPESSATRTVRLYECVKCPYEWKFVMNLIEDISAVDPTLVRHDGKWWLFVNTTENRGASCNDELFVFSSQELLSKHWVSHPMNPVISDVKRARPAGRVFRHEGNLYRPSQDCSGIYGRGINVNEIMVLSETCYQERPISRIEPAWDPAILGVHTFNREGRLVVLDAFHRRRRVF